MTPAQSVFAPKTPAPATPATPEMRDFGDSLATRRFIYEDALNAARGIEPLSDDRHTLKLTGVDWADPERFSRRRRKEAVLLGETLSRRMRGTWELYDNASGKLLQRRTQVVAAVPYLSSMGTFTHRGNEYTVNQQQRLRPGVFTRVKDNGELEAHANILPGKGLSHRYFLDPAKNVFKIHVAQSEMPLLPLLQAMGATDRELREAWGDKILADNYQKSDASVLKKLAQKILRPADLADEGTARQKLVAAFGRMELDPEVTRRTLGQPFRGMDKDALLATTRKLLAVSRGEQEPDDRDHLAYQTFLGPEDLFSERIRRDHGRHRAQLFRKVSLAGSLDKMPSGALTPQLEQVLLGSGLAQALEEINPAEVFDKQSRITRMGEGGIPSIDSIPAEARAVQPSHMNFMDPIRTPESERLGVDVHMARNARKGRDGTIYSRFVDRRTGREVWKSPRDVVDAAIATPDNMKADTRTIPVMKGGKLDYVTKEEVDYVLPDFEGIFSPLGNLVPLKSGVKQQRVAMASRMLTQALPLLKPEAPLVQSGLPGSGGARSFEQEYGRHMGGLVADKGGRVVGADQGSLKVRYDDGSEDEIELYDHHPFNRKSLVGGSEVSIKRGHAIRTHRIDEYEWQPGDLTLSVDPDTKLSAWLPVTGYLKHRNDKKLLTVRTESGREVTVTEDHSLVTVGDDGNLSPLYPADCVIGKTRLPVALLSTNLPVATPPDRSAYDTGVLAGLYLSEGHRPDASPSCIHIAVKPEDRAVEVSELLRRLGFVPARDAGKVRFTDRGKAEHLVTAFGHLAHNKRVPDGVLYADASYRLGLVAGYLAGDGCLWADGNGAVQVSAVSASRALRDGMVSVLSSLGVFCTLFDAPRNHVNKNWRDCYGFRVISGHITRLGTWFFYSDREEKLRRLVKEKYRSSPFEAVPVPSVAARRTLYDGFSSVTPKYVHKTALSGAVAKHRLRGCSGPFGLWGLSDVMWDRVVEILPAEHEDYVYDLSVGRSEVFAVNGGLIVHNTYIHQTPLVKPGDSFAKGQALVKSNYTDDEGTAALGLNARVAYWPYLGYNYEDAAAISESFAKRMTSEHMYQHDVEVTPRHKMGRNAFVNLFPAKYDRKTLDSLDDKGVVRPGATVEFGQPLILAARERDRAQNKIHKKRQAGYVDESVVWGHHDPGVVTDVVWGKDGPVVLVKTASPMQVGDKLSGRYGDKSVVAEIIPDERMPHGADGKPFELLLSPTGIVSRTNPSQKYEAWLGKVALADGKAVRPPDFEREEDLDAWVNSELKKRGLSGTEEITWPEKRMKVPGVATGHRFIMKLHHTAESKGQGRSSGAYTMEDAPAKGGETGCFVGDTYVRVDNGWDFYISEIVENRYRGCADSADPKSAFEKCHRGITDHFHYRVPAADLVTVELEDGRTLSCTRNHEMVLADGTRKRAGDLVPGDDLMEAK
jgi:DNA-directed RNA polymerase beta subunit/intein/homing endonuclease